MVTGANIEAKVCRVVSLAKFLLRGERKNTKTKSPDNSGISLGLRCLCVLVSGRETTNVGSSPMWISLGGHVCRTKWPRKTWKPKTKNCTESPKIRDFWRGGETEGGGFHTAVRGAMTVCPQLCCDTHPHCHASATSPSLLRDDQTYATVAWQ